MSVPVNEIKSYWTDDGRFIWSGDVPTPEQLNQNTDSDPYLVETLKSVFEDIKKQAETVGMEPGPVLVPAGQFKYDMGVLAELGFPSPYESREEYGPSILEKLRDKDMNDEQQDDKDKSDFFTIRMRVRDDGNFVWSIDGQEATYVTSGISSRGREGFRDLRHQPDLEQDHLKIYATAEQFEEVLEVLAELKEATTEILESLSRLRESGL